MRRDDHLLRSKSFDFALRIVKLSRYLRENHSEYVLSKQLLRSGTAIGALLREAQYAQSTADFLHKFTIALKEANETEYWLQLLHQSEYLTEKSYISIHNDCKDLLRMLIAATKTLKEKQ